MDIVREEIFGPVVTLIKFDTVDEAVGPMIPIMVWLLVFTLLTLTNVLMWTELKPVLFGSTLITISTQWFHSGSVLQVSVEMGEEFYEYTQVRAVRMKINPPNLNSL